MSQNYENFVAVSICLIRLVGEAQSVGRRRDSRQDAGATQPRIPTGYGVPGFVSNVLGEGTGVGLDAATGIVGGDTGTGADWREYAARSSHRPKIIFPAVVCSTAVSYTHLDVYKRQ